MLKLKLQYFGHLMQRVDSLEKTDAGRDWGQEEKGTTEDEMAGWHHWLDGRESEWTLGVGDGQGSLACCDSWGRTWIHRVGHDWVTELNWTELPVSVSVTTLDSTWKWNHVAFTFCDLFIWLNTMASRFIHVVYSRVSSFFCGWIISMIYKYHIF